MRCHGEMINVTCMRPSLPQEAAKTVCMTVPQHYLSSVTFKHLIGSPDAVAFHDAAKHPPEASWPDPITNDANDANATHTADNKCFLHFIIESNRTALLMYDCRANHGRRIRAKLIA